MVLEYQINSPEGLHARPATRLVKLASTFVGNIQLEYNGKLVNMKSMLMVLSLGIPNGATFKIHLDGHKEEDMKNVIEAALREEALI